MRWNSRWKNYNPTPASILVPTLSEDHPLHMTMKTAQGQDTDISMISNTDHLDHLALGDHPVHADTSGHQLHHTLLTLASGHRVLDDHMTDVMIPSDRKAHTTNMDQARLDMNRTATRDIRAHLDITHKVHHLLNIIHRNAINLNGNHHSRTVTTQSVAILTAIITMRESCPIAV